MSSAFEEPQERDGANSKSVSLTDTEMCLRWIALPAVARSGLNLVFVTFAVTT